MNKNCARCTKVVYPIEEFKCLDKVHEGIFYQKIVCKMHWHKIFMWQQKSLMANKVQFHISIQAICVESES